jgi:hypothetical protein
VEHVWGEDGFDGVADGVTKVDEVSESSLAFVDGDDVGFDVDTASDDGEEERLGDGASADVTTCVACGRGADGIVDLGSVAFE